MADRDRGADRWRKQHGHPLGLALVPHRDQVLGVLEGSGDRSRGVQPLPARQLAGKRPPFCAC
jgi:hypothetical protein